MARSYLEEQKEKMQQQAQAAQQQYSGMRGVSDSTGQRLAQAQAQYQPGQQAQQAQQNLQSIQAQKPQTYSSKYGAALDNILQQIQNPGEFKYSFNGDELFKAYADMYTQQAKQASMNAMGNAAGLTGGYGNSYAQAAGSQAYQQNIMPLYERGMQLAQMAQDRYNAGRTDLYNQMSALQGMEDTEYGRYRDTVGDWQAELDRAREDSRYEQEQDYQRYRDNLEYYTGLAQLENQDWNTQAEREEAIRQYNQDFAERQRQYDESLAESQRQANMDEAYRRDTLNWQQDTDARDYAERVRQANLDEAYRQATFDWQKAADERDFNAEQYRADQDEAYRQQMFNWQQNTDQRDFNEQVRQANLDNAYRNRTLEWQQDTDARDYEEAVRQANLDEAYRRDTLGEQIRQADLDEAYRQQTFDESVRQADLDEAYRRDTLAETQRQADLDEAYRRDSLAQNQAQFEATTELDWASLVEKQREYDAGLSEEQRQYNQKMAASWVADILANGQIPSNELLVAAGLSLEDAQKLVAQVQAAGPGGPGPGDETPNLKEDIAAGKYKIGGNGVTPDEYKEFKDWHNETGGDQGAQYAPVTSNMDSTVSVTKNVEANPGTTQNTTKKATTTMTAAQYNTMLRNLWDEDLKKKKG